MNAAKTTNQTERNMDTKQRLKNLKMGSLRKLARNFGINPAGLRKHALVNILAREMGC